MLLSSLSPLSELTLVAVDFFDKCPALLTESRSDILIADQRADSGRNLDTPIERRLGHICSAI
jgi:hypothetical protein